MKHKKVMHLYLYTFLHFLKLTHPTRFSCSGTILDNITDFCHAYSILEICACLFLKCYIYNTFISSDAPLKLTIKNNLLNTNEATFTTVMM